MVTENNKIRVVIGDKEELVPVKTTLMDLSRRWQPEYSSNYSGCHGER